MAMVFSLVSEGQEWLSARYEKEVKEREAEEERLLLEKEEEERVSYILSCFLSITLSCTLHLDLNIFYFYLFQNRFEGTKVNVQNFIEWKKGFDAEMAKKRQSQLEKEKELIGNELTGKELFLRDNTLNESDLQFVEEGESNQLIHSLNTNYYKLSISIYRGHRN
jgi:hypothetical protein